MVRYSVASFRMWIWSSWLRWLMASLELTWLRFANVLASWLFVNPSRVRLGENERGRLTHQPWWVCILSPDVPVMGSQGTGSTRVKSIRFWKDHLTEILSRTSKKKNYWGLTPSVWNYEGWEEVGRLYAQSELGSMRKIKVWSCR